MVKRHSSTNDPQQWLAELSKTREAAGIPLLQSAVALYGTGDSPLLKKGLGIADVLVSLKLDSETVAAAIVYPALQAHELHIDSVIECLGENCRKLLHDVLQMQTLRKLHHRELRGHHQIENLRKMLLAMVTDVRAVLIVLAERLWQLHEAKSSSEEEKHQLAQETLAVFAPLANRLGVWQLKWEIEDLCLRYLKPDIYSKIAKWLASRRQEREEYIHRVIDIVTEMLTQAQVKKFNITGRVKHIYSIYRKMQRKGSSFEKIYDVSAIRILVNDIADCYSVLGLLQDKWEQIPEEFDDYISQPKPNGYRSIHTVVIGPENHYVEVQIRTYEMHQESELGMAAHWQYKEGVLQPSDYEAKIALLRQIIAWQKEVVSTEDKSEQSLQDIFTDRVYVFTPTGDIIDLPQGSTPLDFAYHIHSEVGHRCRGAKIHGNIVPLTHALQTGDRVEILTAKEARPSRDWLLPQLGYLKTPRARAKVQHWFRVKDELHNVAAGREILERELKKNNFHEKVDLTSLAGKMNYKSADDLLIALSTGELRPIQIMNQLRPVSIHAPHQPAARQVEHEKKSNVEILGIDNLLTTVALCCKPLPGDAVVGYITRNRGVSIHRRDCNNITQISQDHQSRLIDVNWGERKVSSRYPVDLLLHVHDRAGLLRDITTLLAGEKFNVLGLQARKANRSNEEDIFLTIEITNRDQMRKAIDLLKEIPSVLEVRRR